VKGDPCFLSLCVNVVLHPIETIPMRPKKETTTKSKSTTATTTTLEANVSPLTSQKNPKSKKPTTTGTITSASSSSHGSPKLSYREVMNRRPNPIVEGSSKATPISGRGPSTNNPSMLGQTEDDEYDEVLKQSVLVAKRSALKSEQTEQIAQQTLVQLHEQSEQLDRVEDNLELAGQNMSHAKMETRRFVGSGFCGFLWLFRRHKYQLQKELLKQQAHEHESTRLVREEARHEKHRKQRELLKDRPSDEVAKKITSSKPSSSHLPKDETTWTEVERRQHARDQAERQIEDNLDQVGKHVRHLTLISQAMGEEVEAQNAQISRMETKSTNVGFDAVRTSRRVRGNLQ
jgi:hypothetical protein